jgi:phytanoyl-CoA hydroxylase
MRRLAEHFLIAGYARLPGRLPEENVQVLESLVDRYFAEGIPPYRVNSEGTIARIDGLVERSPVFLEVLQSPSVRPYLEDLLGPAIDVARFRHNHATLNRENDQVPRLHRDVQQWSRAILNVFIYLEDASAENGATLVVPGSQNLPYCGPQAGGGGGAWADEYEEYEHLIGQEVPVPAVRGGVLLMNGLAFHSVGENKGAGTRKSLVFACTSADDLSSPDTESYVSLVGKKRFKGNSAQRVSGGLEVPSGIGP